VVADSYRPFLCLWCGRQVRICASCDWGQRYCPDAPCGGEARNHAKRRYRADYQRTRKGRRAHAQSQLRYRVRLLAKKVTDHPSPAVSASVNIAKVETLQETADVDHPVKTEARVRCDSCGVLCGPFVHRWLGRW
jgi:hypothetical protein